jgi:aldehyde dehydrogenase (NAD+)
MFAREMLIAVAAIYTSDVSRVLRLSAKIDSGNVSVNAPHFPSYHVPFGGWKDSGNGQELGKYGFYSYLQTKSIHIK